MLWFNQSNGLKSQLGKNQTRNKYKFHSVELALETVYTGVGGIHHSEGMDKQNNQE